MISSTTGAGLVLPSYNPNGASTGPLEVGVFMEIVGLHRMSTAPEDAELYGRLQEWAWHHRRLSPLEQEAAFRLSRPELERRGVEEPNYWLRAAIRHAERFPFQSGDKEKAELNRILTIDELLAAPERPTPWAIYGFVARGEITTLAAPPKTGKTTLSAQAANCVAAGLPFLGREVTQGAVAWLDLEQSQERSVRLFRALGSAGLPIHYLRGDSNLVAELRAREVVVLFVDSFIRWCSGAWSVPKVEDMNDQTQTTNALAAIRDIAERAESGVWSIDHTRKSGGEHGQEVAGSLQKVGQSDHIVSMKRDPKGVENRRVLDGVSREQEAAPNKLLIEYVDGVYRAIGTVRQIRDQEHRDTLLECLDAEPRTYEQLAGASELALPTVKKITRALYEEGVIQREGEGKRGNPFLFSRNEE